MNLDDVRTRLRSNPRAVDLLLTLAVLVLAIMTAVFLVAPATPQGAPGTGMIIAWAGLLCAPLLLRRRYPLTVLVISAVHFPLYWAVGRVHEVAAWLVLGIAVYSAAAYGRRPHNAWTVGIAGLVSAVFYGVVMVRVLRLPPPAVVAATLFNAIPYLVAWPMGSMMRRLREYREALQARNRELAAQREANARRAVLEERLRIARELHDVLAHHVSVMGIQAGVARSLFDRRPTDAVAAISDVESASRQAIADLHQLVGVLRRQDEADDDLAPQPSLRQLPDLVAQMRRAGLTTQLTVHGDPRELPAAIELSAYRIVQEALTNTLRHAGPAKADVSVRFRDGTVEVEVTDDGRGPPVGARAREGKGLLGMSERVALHGGSLDVGRAPDGGFRVHAVLGGDAS